MDMDNIRYGQKVMEHFQNPRKVGALADADGVGKVSSPVCGDILNLYIRVKDNIIVDAKFKTFGCAAAIASSSILTELIKGKSIEEVRAISNQAVVKALGGLPPVKLHCSVLAEQGLKFAIDDYLKKIS